MPRLLLTGSGTMITLLLIWFAFSDYRSSRPMAEENLLGLAHSLAAAIGNSVLYDPSLKPLSTFYSRDIAYFALVDSQGKYRFHSNEDLIGSTVKDEKILQQMSSGETTAGRLLLATGEEAYSFFELFQFSGEKLGLTLVLHTYRADSVIRRTRINMLIISLLLVAGWGSALVVLRFSKRELRMKQEMAKREHLARMGEMGATLAHEIRNPLAGIKGFAQLIEKRPDDPRTKDSARRIVTETKRLEALVTDLLTFAGSGGSFPLTALSAGDVIEQVSGLLALEADQSKVSIVCRCESEILISGNRDRLIQMLLNICKNALQAMPEGGTLQLSVKRAGKSAEIMVTDSGRGIEKELLPKVFEPFFTTRARGTGLGLALCKKIADEHQGEIILDSSDQGTVVTVKLPMAIGERI